MNSVIDLGFISIHYYSIIILLAFLVAYFIIEREAIKFQIEKNFIFNLVFWIFIFGIIGARLYYVLFNFNYYSDNLLEIFELWKGGLAIHGGIIFGVLFTIFYCHKYKTDTFRILDILVVGLIIGQAIGRWGNFFNSEAHGPIISLDVMHHLFIPKFVIDGMFIDGAYYLPTFYLESLACLGGFIILLIFRRMKYTKVGQISGLYLVIYGTIRFVIEYFRTDSLMFFSFKMAQIVSLLMVILGILIIIKKKGRTHFDNLYSDQDNVRKVDF